MKKIYNEFIKPLGIGALVTCALILFGVAVSWAAVYHPIPYMVGLLTVFIFLVSRTVSKKIF